MQRKSKQENKKTRDPYFHAFLTKASAATTSDYPIYKEMRIKTGITDIGQGQWVVMWARTNEWAGTSGACQ